MIQATIFVLVFSFVSNRQKLPVSSAARFRRFLGAHPEDFADIPPSKLDATLIAAAGYSTRRQFANGSFRFGMFAWMFGLLVFFDYADSSNWPYPEHPWLSWLMLVACFGIMVPFARRRHRTALLRELHRLRAMSPAAVRS